MCLVYRKQNHKVISVSRKKVTCHEGMYANFDPSKAQTPDPTVKELPSHISRSTTSKNRIIIKQESCHSPTNLRSCHRKLSIFRTLTFLESCCTLVPSPSLRCGIPCLYIAVLSYACSAMLSYAKLCYPVCYAVLSCAKLC
jgi:hypothetical protein